MRALKRCLLLLLTAATLSLVMTVILSQKKTGLDALFHHQARVPPKAHDPSNIQHQLDDYSALINFSQRKHGSYFGFMPSIHDVEYNNKHWQVFHNSEVTMFVYSAFYDARLTDETFVRVLGLVKNADPNTTPSYCQFWFDDVSGVVSVEVTSYHHLWEKAWGNPGYDHLQPYLVTCKLPADLRGQVPVAVSLAIGPRKRATTLLPVVNTTASPSRHKGDFAVCVKGLNYIHEDISEGVIEWLELMRAFGVGKVFMYKFTVPPSVQEVLLQYQNEGFLELRETSLPDTLPNNDLIRELFFKDRYTDKRQIEVIIYNDCFYRSIGQFDYIALLDIDEIIFPVQDESWKQLKVQVDRNISLVDPSHTPSCYCFHNYYFSSSSPSDGNQTGDSKQTASMFKQKQTGDSKQTASMFKQKQTGDSKQTASMLKQKQTSDSKQTASMFKQKQAGDSKQTASMFKQTLRALHPAESGRYTKCLHSSQLVLAVHNHYPLYCLEDKPCSWHFVDTAIGRLNHYRGRCHSELTREGKCTLDQTVFDDSISKFRSEVQGQVEERLSSV